MRLTESERGKGLMFGQNPERRNLISPAEEESLDGGFRVRIRTKAET
jgi:hypothetical protein